MPRVLAFDFGTRRIGVAVSDPTGTIASPLTTLVRREGKRPPWAEIQRLVDENEATALVIGLPLELSGEESGWTEEVRAFGEQLQRRTSLPIHWIDERMSSVQAERAVRSLGLKRKERERKERVDAAAASLILQQFLRTRDGDPSR